MKIGDFHGNRRRVTGNWNVALFVSAAGLTVGINEK